MNKYNLLIVNNDGEVVFTIKDLQEYDLDNVFARNDIINDIQDAINYEMEKE